MNHYDIFLNSKEKRLGVRIMRGSEPDLYFCGYDFMGSVIWSTEQKKMYDCTNLAEARQIVADMESADM